MAGPVASGGLTPAAARSDRANAIPRISHDQRQEAASGGVWLHRPRSTQRRHSAVSLDFSWWQVLGSNQRRRSRRFYREPIPAHRNAR
jgi:hypothetical protein